MATDLIAQAMALADKQAENQALTRTPFQRQLAQTLSAFAPENPVLGALASGAITPESIAQSPEVQRGLAIHRDLVASNAYDKANPLGEAGVTYPAFTSPGMGLDKEMRAGLERGAPLQMYAGDVATQKAFLQQQESFGNTLGGTPGEPLPTEAEIRDQFTGGKLIMVPGKGFVLGGATPNAPTAAPATPWANRYQATPAAPAPVAPAAPALGGARPVALPTPFGRARAVGQITQALSSAVPSRGSVAQALRTQAQRAALTAQKVAPKVLPPPGLTQFQGLTPAKAPPGTVYRGVQQSPGYDFSYTPPPPVPGESWWQGMKRTFRPQPVQK